MRFYWIQDRIKQNQFHVYWKPGKTNLADYLTKHHTAKHHQTMRPLFLHQSNLLQALGQLRLTLNPPHCKGVLIPRPTRCLGTIDQHDQIHGQTDMRLRAGSQSGQKHVHNHRAITCVGPKDPKGNQGLIVAS